MSATSPEDVIPTPSLNVSDEVFHGVTFQLRGMITHESKCLLTSSEKRDPDAIFRTITELEVFDFFNKFPNDIKFKLVEKMIFLVYEADEYLFKQDDAQESMYLIISGVVALRYNLRKSIVTDSNIRTRWPERILRRGDVFGEIDLIQNRPASVDAYAVGYSELLEIKRENFDLISNYLEEDIARLRSYIRSCEPLIRFNWSEEELNVLEIFSQLRNYLEEVGIYNDQHGIKPRWSYFVVSGECKLCRDINYPLSQSSSFGSKMVTNSKHSKHSDSKFLKKDVEFEIGRQGFFFAVGENFDKNKILATPALEYLLVLRLVLVFKDKELLKKMADDLEDSLPSDEIVSRYFMDYEKTSKEVEVLIKEILKDKPWRLLSNQKSKQKPPFIKYV